MSTAATADTVSRSNHGSMDALFPCSYSTALLVSSLAFLCLFLIFSIVKIVYTWRRRSSRASDQEELNLAPQKGLDKSTLSSFPTTTLNALTAGKGDCESFRECAVCLSEYESGDVVKTLPHCGHQFHAECIDEWLSARVSCPICRRDLGMPVKGVSDGDKVGLCGNVPSCGNGSGSGSGSSSSESPGGVGRVVKEGGSIDGSSSSGSGSSLQWLVHVTLGGAGGGVDAIELGGEATGGVMGAGDGSPEIQAAGAAASVIELGGEGGSKGGVTRVHEKENTSLVAGCGRCWEPSQDEGMKGIGDDSVVDDSEAQLMLQRQEGLGPHPMEVCEGSEGKAGNGGVCCVEIFECGEAESCWRRQAQQHTDTVIHL